MSALPTEPIRGVRAQSLQWTGDIDLGANGRARHRQHGSLGSYYQHDDALHVRWDGFESELFVRRADVFRSMRLLLDEAPADHRRVDRAQGGAPRDRLETLKGMFDTSGTGLEIGPSYNPVLRKRDGHRVGIVDYTTTERLRQIHPKADIEDVDHVTDGRRMTEVIPRRRAYDFIIASHVIEHAPDLLQFLLDCAALLKESGVLVLAVPDKRHCFDVFQPVSTTGEVLQAHLERRMRVQPGKHFDHVANAAVRHDVIVWNEGFAQPAKTLHSPKEAHALFSRAAGAQEYIDNHVWRFLPSSFRLIARDLDEIGVLSLKEVAFIDSSGPEFYISLSATGAGCGIKRLDLLRATMTEMWVVPMP